MRELMFTRASEEERAKILRGAAVVGIDKPATALRAMALPGASRMLTSEASSEIIGRANPEKQELAAQREEAV